MTPTGELLLCVWIQHRSHLVLLHQKSCLGLLQVQNELFTKSTEDSTYTYKPSMVIETKTSRLPALAYHTAYFYVYCLSYGSRNKRTACIVSSWIKWVFRA